MFREGDPGRTITRRGVPGVNSSKSTRRCRTWERQASRPRCFELKHYSMWSTCDCDIDPATLEIIQIGTCTST